MKAIFLLKDLRQAANISQEVLADKCNLTQSYISILENGHKLPSIEAWLKISEALEVCPYKLIRIDLTS